jgi:hypothetical protein
VRRLTRLRPSRPMTVAFVALFAALAGTATAAKVIDGGDIKNSSITAKDIKDGSLLKKDFKRGQLPAGARGLQGAQGPAGPSGRAGRDGFGRLEYETDSATIADTGADTGGFLTVDCPTGTYPTGGDAAVIDDNGDFRPDMLQAQFFDIGLDDRPGAWTVIVSDNNTPGPVDVFVEVICANANPAPDPVPLLKAKELRGKLQPLR